MTAYCIRNCIKYKARKPPLGTGRYAVGQKRCQMCEIFIHWDGLKCPCCSSSLRRIPRSRKGKEKYFVQKIFNPVIEKYDEL